MLNHTFAISGRGHKSRGIHLGSRGVPRSAMVQWISIFASLMFFRMRSYVAGFPLASCSGCCVSPPRC